MGFTIGPTLAISGEAEYTAAMKRVRESMQYVKAEANAAISVFNKNEKSVESLTAQINSSKKAFDVQKQAVKAAEDALERMKANGVDESSTAYKRMEANLNNAKAALNGTEKEIEEQEKELKQAADAAGEMALAQKTVGDTAKSAGAQMKGAGNETKGFKAQIKDFASSSVGQMATFAGAFALAKEAVQALWKMVDEATNAADALITLSNQTGVATDKLQEYAYAARFVDVEVEMMTKGLSRVVMEINKAKTSGDDYIRTAGGLTISLKDANGQLKDSEELFYNAVDAIGNLANETEREAAAQDIFGRSYQDIMPLIKAGSGALEGYASEARNVGATVDITTIAALGRLDDKFEQTSAIADAEGKKIAAALAPATDALAEFWSSIKKSAGDSLMYPDPMIKGWQVRYGMTEEEVKAQLDSMQQIKNLAYALGLEYEEAEAKVNKYTDYLISTGMETEAAHALALANTALNLDELAYQTAEAERAQKGFDDAITSALENYKTKNAEYLAEIKSTADGYISSMGGIFDEFKTNTDVTGDQLLANLESQEQGIAEWATNIDSLAKKNIDQGLMDSLRKMGPAAAGEIAALNSLSDPKLREYVTSWKNMSDTATAEAEKANADMKYQVLKSLDEMKYAIDDKEAGMEQVAKTLGLGITDGIIDGLDSSKVNNKIVDMANEALRKAKKALGIASPSKVFRDEVGKQISAGIALGIDKNAEQAIKAAEALTHDMALAFKASSAGISAGIPRSIVTAASPTVPTVTSITKEIIRDSGITVQLTGDTHIHSGQDIDTVATQLAQKVKRALAAQGVA